MKLLKLFVYGSLHRKKTLGLCSSMLPYIGTGSWVKLIEEIQHFLHFSALSYCSKWFKAWVLLSFWLIVLSSYSDNWQIRFLSSSTGLSINWYSEASNWLTTMPFWVGKNPEDPIKYLCKLLMESEGYIIKVILDYLKESECPVGHFASHAYEPWEMQKEAMGHS